MSMEVSKQLVADSANWDGGAAEARSVSLRVRACAWQGLCFLLFLTCLSSPAGSQQPQQAQPEGQQPSQQPSPAP
ncbi:MAG: hypothetical protein ABSH52_08035, partial [Terriglobia bacterium]